MVKVEWHDQDYLHLKWHVVYRGLAIPDLDNKIQIIQNVNSVDPLAGAKVDWDFRISDLVKNPDGTDV